jgi:acetoin utilization deacetylase AcuC-like enzyme
MFLNDPTVLYFSVHRYDNAHFYPYSVEAGPDMVGEGEGKGYSVNVGWNLPVCFSRFLLWWLFFPV